MKLMSVLIMIFVFFSCNEQKKEVDFDCIDYYCFAGYSESIKIFNNRRTFITFNNSHDERSMYYSLTLDKESMDSISKMTEKLFNDKLDTIYQGFDADHPQALSLIIKSKGRKILISYRGDLIEEKLNSLFQLTRYLDELIYKHQNKLAYKLNEPSDSAIVSESKSRLILPPPPPAADIIEKKVPNK
ncbi:MAG: hypothetical protein NTY07_09860 [Bacteroidia bacterium]|nr:hypothetical protein [Bacteroidia bacterium]